jgi:acetyl esterase/lipase
VSSLRFDIGGWGDSPGEPQPFESSDLDIMAALVQLSDELQAPSRLWVLGLCDGASAAVLALPALRAVGAEPAALCLLNPWVRTDASLSDAMVRTYYAKRIFQKEFWGRLLTGKVSAASLIREPLRHLTRRFGAGGRGAGDSRTEVAPDARAPDLPTQLIEELGRYQGRVLTVLSGNDLTAGETESLMKRDKRWRKRLDRKGEILRVAGADHTFSEPSQWAQVARWLAERAKER